MLSWPKHPSTAIFCPKAAGPGMGFARLRKTNNFILEQRNMLIRLLARIAILSFVLFAVVSLASAQGGNQGAIQGTLTDQTGAVVSGAELTATHTETGATFKTTSKEDGFFEFPLLPVGLYDLAVKKGGFATISEKGVKLTIGAKLNLRLELKVSATSETVTVTGQAPVVETTRTQVSATVDDQAV